MKQRLIIISYLHRNGGLIIRSNRERDEIFSVFKEGGVLTDCTTALKDKEYLPTQELNEYVMIPKQLADNAIIEVFDVDYAEPMPVALGVEFSAPTTTA